MPFTPPNWLGSSEFSKWSVVILTLWKNTGFTMVVYLAALQGVPQELYDAATVDGASAWQRFRACHAAADQPDDLLPLHLPDDRRVPAFHRAVRDDAAAGRPTRR
jgi:hypothetical protein